MGSDFGINYFVDLIESQWSLVALHVYITSIIILFFFDPFVKSQLIHTDLPLHILYLCHIIG
jgi:hypothetical protein